MTSDERILAELAVDKRNLTAQLTEVRKQMRALVPKVELPVIVVLNGDAVLIEKPPYYNAMPTCKVARCLHP